MLNLPPETIARMLADAQKQVYDLAQVKPTDRNYKAAQAKITLLTAQPYWREPKTIPVQNICDHAVTVDGTKILPGTVESILEWQLPAMSRWLKPVNPPPAPDPAAPVATASGRPAGAFVSTKKMTDLLAKIAETNKESAELERMAKAALDDMRLVAASNMALEPAKKKIGEANLTLDFVKARQEKTSAPVRLVFAQLQTELFQQVENWNAVIGALRQGIEGAVVKVNTDFFNGDERACRRVFESGVISQMPVFAAFREAIYDEIGLRRLEGDQLVNRAKHFLAHFARHCKALKINPETLA